MVHLEGATQTGGVSEQGAQRAGPSKRKDDEKSYIMGSSIDYMLQGLLGLLPNQGKRMQGGWRGGACNTYLVRIAVKPRYNTTWDFQASI